eukprot:CAMPEP_0171297690 /NCGR_PEP_ID=MMETSP0816-20121228/6436_1 /TAXON_ID=420281 /ORGANISM="Proboscia inermis, Strain CCAP1064/1" /LENGTH=256 /DNA_ID=CAMNT_0011772157 /DNA_START=58 /DNA_END=828 /DNA_ORIENTATION=+
MSGGNGKMNYDLSKPTVPYTDSTTQFDDELIRRGIIIHEQAIMAKGAACTSDEASRILREKDEAIEQSQSDRLVGAHTPPSSEDEGDDIDDDFEDNDEFVEKYRRMRLLEMKRKQQKPNDSMHGDVIPITRSDWTREVNDYSASSNGSKAVVVNLTGPCSELIEEHVKNLAREHQSTKFVSIPSQQAIENWPDCNLPTLFVYSGGKMVHQLVGMDDFSSSPVGDGDIKKITDKRDSLLSQDELELKLRLLGVFGNC